MGTMTTLKGKILWLITSFVTIFFVSWLLEKFISSPANEIGVFFCFVMIILSLLIMFLAVIRIIEDPHGKEAEKRFLLVKALAEKTEKEKQEWVQLIESFNRSRGQNNSPRCYN